MAEQRVRGARLEDDGTVVIEGEDDFCIENASRRVHGRLVAGLLDGSLEGDAVERAAERLARFLSNADFRALRDGDPDLRGPLARPVRLVEDAAGRVVPRKE
ncbi:MAG: hypothetical protein JXB32_25610 [Deltaproteobacteria bacterium]|nr:hypothetical protein [Deltaproteobacteria bacterium]